MKAGVVIYVRPQDVDLFTSALEDAADDFRYAPANSARLLADRLDEYVQVIEDQL